MTMDEPVAPSLRRTLLSAPSLAMDLSWVISVAVRPQWRPKFPAVFEHLAGREELVERVRTFWSDCDHDTCFTEMQVLAHHAGALEETSPPALWAALEGAIATVPTDIALESESPEDRLIFLGRLERLKESPTLFRSYMDLLREVWEPIDEIWQPALPMLREAGRQVVAEMESGRTLSEVTRGESCEIFKARLGDITQRIDSGYPLLVVPCLFFGNSLYLEFPGLTARRLRPAAERRGGAGPHRVAGAAPQDGGRPHPPGPPALPGRDPEHGGRSGHVVRPGPTDDQHAHEVAP